jgi:hypothetical protein
MHAHVRLMLQTVYALVHEQLHLVDVEEFRRLKGYEGEIEELEEIIKERASFFEVFCLVHDAAKWACVTFSAPHGSRGRELGFDMTLTYEFDVDHAKRVELRESYRELFHEFSLEHRNESPQEMQKRFYEVYKIDVHYPHHDRMIFTHTYHALLERFSLAHRLTPLDQSMLEDIIGHHLLIGADFSEVRPSRVKRYMFLAQKRGYDADDFIDLMQACLFLDMTAGSMRKKGSTFIHDPLAFINFLRSEHEYAPERRLKKEVERVEQQGKERRRCFREAGLDGVAMLELLRMDPGPEFGRRLKKIHQAILGETSMPPVPLEIRKEFETRVSRFYQCLFKRGV